MERRRLRGLQFAIGRVGLPRWPCILGRAGQVQGPGQLKIDLGFGMRGKERRSEGLGFSLAQSSGTPRALGLAQRQGVPKSTGTKYTGRSRALTSRAKLKRVVTRCVGTLLCLVQHHPDSKFTRWRR